MFFEAYKSILFSDTSVPDIFISEYMPSMDGDCVRIYLHCLFLSKYNKTITTEEISKKLGLDMDKTKQSFTYLESVGVLTWKQDSIVLTDLKEKEVNKMYRLKTTSTPSEASLSSERNKRRNEIIYAINNNFFQGVMSPSWYTDIDAWFDRYKFDEDVMLALFQHCYDHKGLFKNYIIKVADSWNCKNIRNAFDLDNYSIDYQRFKDVRLKILKKLKLDRNLTEYESEYVEKWVMDFKYDFEIIELALKKTTGKTNPTMKYIDAIICEWNRNSLKNKDEIIAYERNRKQAMAKKSGKAPAVPQKDNYEQRKYDKDYFDSLYEEV
jgi:DnaD/phage-associated family protein